MIMHAQRGPWTVTGSADAIKPDEGMLQGDVRELKDCENAVAAATDKWGRLDILVNAAAGNFLAPAEVLSPKGFKTGFAHLSLANCPCCVVHMLILPVLP